MKSNIRRPRKWATVATNAVRADPPDADYRQLFVPTIAPPSVPLTGTCSDLGLAAQAAPSAVDQMNDWLSALYVTNNRYQTAEAAGNYGSAVLQQMAFQNYLGSYNSAAKTAQTDISCFADLLASSGLNTGLPTQQQEADALDELNTVDLADLQGILDPLGFSAADIAAFIADVKADPQALPTETPVEALDDAAASLGQSNNVPEPGSLLLLFSGLAGFGAIGGARVVFRRTRGVAGRGGGTA